MHAPSGSGCIDSQELLQAIEQRTGRRASRAEGEVFQLSVTVTFAERGTGHHASVSIADRDGNVVGRRELQVTDGCRELDDALVLVIASGLGVSPAPALASTRRSRLSTEPNPRDELALPSPDSLPVTTTSTTPESPSHWTIDLEAQARLLQGTFPALTGAAGLGLRTGRGAWSVRTTAFTTIPRHARAANDVTIEMWSVMAEIDGCGRPVSGARAALLLCAGVQFGATRVEADLWRSRQRWDGNVQLVPSVWLSGRAVGPVGVGLGVGAAIPVLAPSYSYRDMERNSAHLAAIELGAFTELAVWMRFEP